MNKVKLYVKIQCNKKGVLEVEETHDAPFLHRFYEYPDGNGTYWEKDDMRNGKIFLINRLIKKQDDIIKQAEKLKVMYNKTGAEIL